MSEPLILTLKKELEKIKTNMTIETNADRNYSHTGGNQYLQEPIQFQISRGNANEKLTFVTNGIKIGAGINHINVKGTVSVLHKESDGRNAFIYIRKNGTKMTEIQHRLQNMNEAYNMSTFYNYMEVKEGDLIQLYIALDNANFTIKGLNKISATQLYVEVVD
jgi:hypothetical protein|nr:MAG TPA: hypothetical protein [Caudoviricetes sp.]